MESQEQHIVLPVENIDHLIPQSSNNEFKRHGILLPNTIRAIFVGPSNCGKTNALFALLLNPNGLRFENVYIYSKSLNQPKYMFLADLLNSVEGVGYYPYSDHETVISPNDAKCNSLMIFDDVACEKQDHIRSFFCMGRHKLIDSFYLAQTYTRIPKHLIRDNANFIVIFKQDEMNLKHIYNDHVNTDMTYDKFKNICYCCWNNENHSFIVIDKDSTLDNGRYRKGFDRFINVND